MRQTHGCFCLDSLNFQAPVVHLGQMFLFNGTFAMVTFYFPSRNWDQELSLFVTGGSMSACYLKTSSVKMFHICGLTLKSGKTSHNDFPKISWCSSRCLSMSNKMFVSYKIWNRETNFPLCVLIIQYDSILSQAEGS